MAMVKANNDNFKQEIFGDEGGKVVLFGASWCGPCKMYHPIVDEYAAENPDVKIVAHDIDEAYVAAEAFGVMSVPTTIIVKGGREVARVTGLMRKAELESFVKENI